MMALSQAATAISSRGCNACRTAVVRAFTNQSVSNAFLFTRTSFARPSIITPSSRAFSTTRRRSENKDRDRSIESIPLKERDTGFGFLEDPDSFNTIPKSPSSIPTSSTEPATSPVTNETLYTSPAVSIEPSTSSVPEEKLDASPISLISESEANALDGTPEVPSSPAPSIPWYLQSQHAPVRTAPETESTARQIIPDLPPNPPPLLKTILDYVSITAGLDDLALLDLRHLDPPPALGPKLIMIIGTARSEKHLHVSADRFCRWLRREHGLRANAAGLLGRNELKIKLRRKMKRMKMLANVGGQELEGNIDDGIRTGWICCTLGKLEAHPDDTEMPGVDVEDFVGFRDIKPGVNVVVQMFTEEKRIEIDLETLWGGVLRSHDRRNMEAEEKLKQWDVEAEISGAKQGTAEDKIHDTLPPSPAASASPPPSAPKLTIPRRPSDPFPSSSDAFPPRKWKGSASDVFPPTSNQDTAKQLRRLHTIGLGLTSR